MKKNIYQLYIHIFIIMCLTTNLYAHIPILTFSWDKMGCQPNNVSQLNFDNTFPEGGCLNVCKDSFVTYRISGQDVEEVDKIKWEVTGGEAQIDDDFAIPVKWDDTENGSINIIVTMKDGTVVQHSKCITKAVSNLIMGWDKIGCQLNNDDVHEIKLDENINTADCLLVCKTSEVKYNIYGDGSGDITTYKWIITGGTINSDNKDETLVQWDNTNDGSIKIITTFTNGSSQERTICVHKVESTLLLDWEKIKESGVSEVKFDKGEDNAECIMIYPDTTILYTIGGNNVENIDTILWTVVNGYTYNSHGLTTPITWYDEDEHALTINITYKDSTTIERKISIVNIARGPIGGGPGALNSIRFTYDANGNQIKRAMIYLSSRQGHEPTTNVGTKSAKDAQVTNEMLLPTEHADVLYYPNPVRSQLYLKWKEKNGSDLQSVQLYDLNGRLMKELKNQSSFNSTEINFESYPAGIYNLILIYNNKENKVLKISKQ